MSNYTDLVLPAFIKTIGRVQSVYDLSDALFFIDKIIDKDFFMCNLYKFRIYIPFYLFYNKYMSGNLMTAPYT